MADQYGASDRPNYLTYERGILSWLFTLDHKRIALMYLAGICTAFLLGGIFAMLLRTELYYAKKSERTVKLTTPLPVTEPADNDGDQEKQPEQAGQADETAAASGAATETATATGRQPKPYQRGNIMDAKTFNQMFTLHGAIMIFLFIIPGIPAIFGNFVLPLMIGAKDVAFPRLNLLSFHLWLMGGIFFLITLVSGGLDTGWTFYTPYSTRTITAAVPALVGVFVLGFSSIFTGLNFMVTLHKMRVAKMDWFKMPLFLWGLYATTLIQVLATPVLGITLLLLLVERVMKVGIFTPEYGGDPVLFQHFFWFYSHPAVYVMILPAMGVISELFATFSRKRIFGYRFIAYSSVAIALLGFLVWGHHMFVSGQSELAGLIFSALTFSIAIPSAIKVFNWLATMYKGSISLETPMCWALSFIFVFGIGGLTGLFLTTLSVNVPLHDTYFVVAHFHYVMVGGMVMAFMGALHYWWPKMFGKMYNENLGRLAAFLVFIGFNLTFFPQFVMGTRGMPRRYYNYLPEFEPLHQLSTIGSYIIAAGFVLSLVYLLYSLFNGRPAPDNPWGAATLEWTTSSPPPPHNFEEPPVATLPYDMENVHYDTELGGYVKREPAASPPLLEQGAAKRLSDGRT